MISLLLSTIIHYLATMLLYRCACTVALCLLMNFIILVTNFQINDAVSDPTGFGISVLVVFGYSFLLASFVLFLVKEKESKV